MYWVVELCKSKRELKMYRDVDWQQFITVMCQCDLISGDMLLIGLFDSPDQAMKFIMEGKISIRDYGFVKSQDNSVIKF